MNLFRSILLGNSEPASSKSGDLASLRERIFQTMMLIASILACFLYATLIYKAISEQSWGEIIFYTLLLVFVWSITIFRRLPYPVRSGGILSVIFLMIVYSLIQGGLSGHSQLFLLGFLIMSATLIGTKALVISFFLCIATLAFFGIGMTQNLLTVPPLGAYGDSSNQLDWLLTGLFMIVFTALTAIPLLVIVNTLQTSLKKQKEIFTQLEDERSSLEERITTRTSDLERRLLQIRTAAEISRSISSVLDPDELLQHVVNLLAERAQLYYAGVFLIDDSGTHAVLRAGSGEAGKAMLAEGHRLQVSGSSMVGWSTATRQARIALDVGKDAVRFNNPHLPFTRSELALPIIGKTRVLGALTIQSDQQNAFDENDILILQGIADSLAIAIENASFFQQNQRDLEEIRSLNQQYLEHAWSEANVSGEMKYAYHNPYAPSGNGNSSLQVPIVVREQPIGKISLDTGGKELSAEEIAMVEAITTQTALALESARLLEEMQRHARLEEKLNQMTAEFWRATEIQDVLQMALKTIGQMPSISEVSVHLMSSEELADPDPGTGYLKEGIS
jgi:GAF domain-containing protein